MSKRVLATQEPEARTFMEVQSIAWFIRNRLGPGQPEGETARVWDEILHHYFKNTDNYSTGPEMQFGKGRADLFTSHLVKLRGKTKEKKFLIVECKAPGKETEGNIWNTAAEQLKKYLECIRTEGGDRIFGATAVGKYVRFYEYLGKNNTGGLFDLLDDGTTYLIDRQCQTVHKRLEYIRDHH